MSKENYGEYAYWCYGLKSEYNKHYHYLTIYTWLQLKHGDISIPVSLKSFLFSWYLVIFYFYFLIFFLFVIGFQMVLNSNYYRVKFTRAHADGTWPIFTAFHNITKRVWLLLFIVNCFLTLKSSHQYACSSFCSLYISYGADKESVQQSKPFLLVIIPFILMTQMFDSGVIL